MKQWKKGAHGNTFGGNPISCAAANATIDLVREQYVQNAAKVGAHFMKRLETMRPDYPCIGDIRGRGLMIGVEMIEERRLPGARDGGPPPATAPITTGCCFCPAASPRCASCRRSA
jgi:4-aminobutyrate aminotransferase